MISTWLSTFFNRVIPPTIHSLNFSKNTNSMYIAAIGV
jgi:hypothetical protein